MADIKSIIKEAEISSLAEIEDVTSVTSTDYYVSKAGFSPASVSKPDVVKAQARAESFGRIQERIMSRDCNLTEEEILQECETVRQELYDKYIVPTRQ